MKILVVGATGDVGNAVCDELKSRHEIITAGRSSGDLRVDLTNEESIIALYREAGQVDAVVSAVGDVKFERLADMTREKYLFGLERKVLGQINLVLKGLDVVADNGSFTLTSGILDRDPVCAEAGRPSATAPLPVSLPPPPSICRAACASTWSVPVCFRSPPSGMAPCFPVTTLYLQGELALPMQSALKEPGPGRW
ncbi:NAD-dependent epimerase/dehydratase family protein [Roseibium sp. SCPC15]|uniref:NAD-dependent epimerase/dehydratase family protein n=1 Tax=Roseibium sp. SCP15 TaxID=3141376 RepID=UPI00333B41F9